jgi:hypothetical protein
LPRESVANASQVATVNKADLDALVGTLPGPLTERVSDGIRWFLKLET